MGVHFALNLIERHEKFFTSFFTQADLSIIRFVLSHNNCILTSPEDLLIQLSRQTLADSHRRFGVAQMLFTQENRQFHC